MIRRTMKLNNEKEFNLKSILGGNTSAVLIHIYLF